MASTSLGANKILVEFHKCPASPQDHAEEVGAELECKNASICLSTLRGNSNRYTIWQRSIGSPAVQQQVALLFEQLASSRCHNRFNPCQQIHGKVELLLALVWLPHLVLSPSKNHYADKEDILRSLGSFLVPMEAARKEIDFKRSVVPQRIAETEPPPG